MRDRSTTNWFGETVDEQEKRRQWLRDVYDRANANDNANTNAVSNAINQNTIYSLGEKAGEFIADVKIAVDEKNEMDKVGEQMVKQYGAGAAKGIDDYYHAKLQCNLAKISPDSKHNGILLGKGKEYIMDYPKKTISNKLNQNEIMSDINKDLQNNQYGSDMGYNNPNKSCVDLLEKWRTPNMRRGRFF